MSKTSKKLADLCDYGIITILYLIAFFIPLIFSRITKQNFLLTKEAWFTGAVITMMALWVIRRIFLMRFDVFRSPLNLAVMAYLAANLLSFHDTVNFSMSLKGLIKVLDYLCLYLIVSTTIKKTRHMNNILFLMIITGGMVALYGVLQFFGFDPFFNPNEVRGATGRSQVFSTFGNPTFLADYLVLTFWLSIFSTIMRFKNAFSWQGRSPAGIVNAVLARHISFKEFLVGIYEISAVWISAFAAAITVFCIILTRTRGAWVAIGLTISVVTVIMMYFRWDMIKRFLRSNMFSKAVIIVLGLIAIFLVFAQFAGFTEFIFDQIDKKFVARFTSTLTVFQRFLMWRVSLNMALDRFWFGHGLLNFQIVYPSFQAEFLDIPGNTLKHGEFAVCYRHAHNEYLQTAVELGFVGLVAFLGMFIAFFYMAVRVLKEENASGNYHGFFNYMGLTAAIAAVLLQSIFNFPFHRCAPQVTVFFILGFMTIRYAGRFDQEEIEDSGGRIQLGSTTRRKRKTQDTEFFDNMDIMKIMLSLLIIFGAFRAFALPIRYFEGSKLLKAGYMMVISRSPGRDPINDLVNSINYLVEAIKQDPVDSETYYWLAFCYEELYNHRDKIRPEYMAHLIMQWQEISIVNRWVDVPGLQTQLPDRMLPDGCAPGDEFLKFPVNESELHSMDLLDLALGTLKVARYYTHNNLVFFRFATSLMKKSEILGPQAQELKNKGDIQGAARLRELSMTYIGAARKNLIIAQRIVPWFPDSFFNQAVIEYQTGNVEKAKELFEWIIYTQPGFYLPYEHLSSLYIQEAMRLQSRPLPNRAENMKELERLGRKIRFNSNRILEIDNGTIYPAKDYGPPPENKVQLARNHINSALQLLDNVAGEHFMDWKNDQGNNKALDRAELIWQFCVDTDPGYANAAYNLGVARYERKDLQEALVIWEKALKYAPQEAKIKSSIAQVKAELGL